MSHSIPFTPSHPIPSLTPPQQVVADDLKVGDCIRTIHGEELIKSIDSQTKYGIYTAITDDAYLIVNGIVASPYSRDSNPGHAKREWEAVVQREKRARQAKLLRGSIMD